MSKPREFWVPPKYKKLTVKPNEVVSICVVEKSAADKLADALEQISTGVLPYGDVRELCYDKLAEYRGGVNEGISGEIDLEEFKSDFSDATKEQVIEAAFIFYKDAKKMRAFSKQEQEISMELVKTLRLMIEKLLGGRGDV